MQLVNGTRVVSCLLILWGIAALFLPRQVADLVGLAIEPGSGNGYAEIGAIHGGMSIALGAIGLFGARGGDRNAILLSALGVIFLALGLGRLFVMLISAPVAAGLTAWGSFAIEIVLGIAYFLAGSVADDSV
jgi:hypothetical protein